MKGLLFVCVVVVVVIASDLSTVCVMCCAGAGLVPPSPPSLCPLEPLSGPLAPAQVTASISSPASSEDICPITL